MKYAATFSPGDLVALASDRSTRGAVVGVQPGEHDCRVQVFVGGSVQTFYASQLVPAPQTEEALRAVTAEEFRARLTALHLLHPGTASLYSLHAARVDFIPYQFRPVLRFIRADRPRLLIADGVGVGKTVEAGLILRELQARRDVKSVLVICPRPLVTERKWERELRRFDERFTQLDGPQLQYCLDETDRDGVWPAQHAKTIIPYSLLDDALLNGKGRKKGLLDLDPPPRFDLVIVDEAHHIRNPETQAHKAVRFFCDHAEAVLFLTATPIQLGIAAFSVSASLNTSWAQARKFSARSHRASKTSPKTCRSPTKNAAKNSSSLPTTTSAPFRNRSGWKNAKPNSSASAFRRRRSKERSMTPPMPGSLLNPFVGWSRATCVRRPPPQKTAF